MKRMVNVGIIITVLVGCAGRPGSESLSRYQGASRKTLEAFSRGVSQGLAPSNAPANARAVVDPFGTTSNLLSPSMYTDSSQCLLSIQSVSPQAQNYQVMVAALSRCLNRILVDSNPLMTNGYRNMDPQGQNLLAYLVNFRQNTSVQNFPQVSFQQINPFLQNGYYSPTGQYPNYNNQNGQYPNYNNQNGQYPSNYPNGQYPSNYPNGQYPGYGQPYYPQAGFQPINN